MKHEKTYTFIWRKYLAVIKIHLKRDLSSEQSFQINSSDFTIGNRPSSGFKFSLKIKEGKLINAPTGSVVGDNLFDLLESDLEIKQIFARKNIAIKMTPDFLITFNQL